MKVKLINQQSISYSNFNVSQGALWAFGIPFANSVKILTSKYLPSFSRLWGQRKNTCSSTETNVCVSFETDDNETDSTSQSCEVDTSVDILEAGWKEEETSITLNLPLNDSSTCVGAVSVNNQLIALEVSNGAIQSRVCNILLYNRCSLNLVNAISIKGVVKQVFLPKEGRSVVIYCSQNTCNSVIAWDLKTNMVRTLILDKCANGYHHDYFFRVSNLLVYTKRNSDGGHSVVVYKLNENKSDKYFELIMKGVLNDGHFLKYAPSRTDLDCFGIFGYDKNGALCSGQIRSKHNFSLLRTISFASVGRISHAGSDKNNVFLLSDCLLLSVNTKKERIEVTALEQDHRLVHCFHKESDSSGNWFNWRNVSDVILESGRLTIIDNCGTLVMWELTCDFAEFCQGKGDILRSTSASLVIQSPYCSRKIPYTGGEHVYQYQFDLKSKKITISQTSYFYNPS